MCSLLCAADETLTCKLDHKKDLLACSDEWCLNKVHKACFDIYCREMDMANAFLPDKVFCYSHLEVDLPLLSLAALLTRRPLTL